jgi:hypothetical protein
MMPSGPAKPLLFGAELANIPLFNLRKEHREAVAAMATTSSRSRLEAGRGLMFLQFPVHEALNFLVQRSILGVESYLPAAVMAASEQAGILTPALARAIEYPKRNRGSAGLYYNHLPGLVSQTVRLRVADKELWKQVSRFYSEIRNPIFHGNQLMDEDGSCTLQILEMFSRVYRWVDSWCPQKWVFEMT